ncbi:MAG: hypothetical protein M1355_01790 [Patescibacteria group bacterium]|nr:hypothetical protein [Patescibacteria group bacterium]
MKNVFKNKLLLFGFGLAIAFIAISYFFYLLVSKVNRDVIQSTGKRQISWGEAVNKINNGEVKSIIQTHNLEVTLILKDGQGLITVESAIDNVFKVIQDCGQKCQDISLATE